MRGGVLVGVGCFGDEVDEEGAEGGETGAYDSY